MREEKTTEEVETILIEEEKTTEEVETILIDRVNNEVITTVKRDDGSILKTKQKLDDWEKPPGFFGEMGRDLGFFFLMLFRVCLFLIFVSICGIVSFYLWKNAGRELLNYLGM